MNYQQANTRKTSNLLKKHLKETFGINCRVKTDKYSMGSSLDVWYDLGPDEKEVNKIVSRMQQGYFDGMTDMYEHVEKEPVIIDGYQLQDFKYSHSHQEIPDEFKYRLIKFLSDNKKYSGVPDLESKNQLNDHFEERFGSAWNWSHLFYQVFRVRNFATQDPEKINLIDVVDSDNGMGEIAFVYEVEGQEYRTDRLPSLRRSNGSKKLNIERVEVEPGQVQIIEYSERSIAVVGDTKPIKDLLKAHGGKFNFRLSCGPGWIFSKTKFEELQKALSVEEVES